MTDKSPITLLSPPDMFRGQTYDHAAIVGDFVYLAGQVARNAQGETIAPNDTAGQAGPLYANVRRVLEYAGCTPDDVVKVTTYLVDNADAGIIIAAHKSFFGAHRPPHTLVAVSGLSRPDMRIEVDVIAYKRRGPG